FLSQIQLRLLRFVRLQVYPLLARGPRIDRALLTNDGIFPILLDDEIPVARLTGRYVRLLEFGPPWLLPSRGDRSSPAQLSSSA
ncbi:MAG: hypothetical protein ACPGPG_11645, partial [Luminiphilus sp.]